MRKRKRAENKLKAAKKQATMMADNSEMSEKMKLKVCDVCPEILLCYD
jgi:hypothetical protein